MPGPSQLFCWLCGLSGPLCPSLSALAWVHQSVAEGPGGDGDAVELRAVPGGDVGWLSDVIKGTDDHLLKCTAPVLRPLTWSSQA